MPRPPNKTKYDANLRVFNIQSLGEPRASNRISTAREVIPKVEMPSPSEPIAGPSYTSPHIMPVGADNSLGLSSVATADSFLSSPASDMLPDPYVFPPYLTQGSPSGSVASYLSSPMTPPVIRLNAFMNDEWQIPYPLESNMSTRLYFTFTQRCFNTDCPAFCTVHLPTNPPSPSLPSFDIGATAYVGFGAHADEPDILRKQPVNFSVDGRRFLEPMCCYCGLSYTIEFPSANISANA